MSIWEQTVSGSEYSRDCDREKVREFLQLLLIEPNKATCIFALPSARGEYHLIDNMDAIVASVESMSDNDGVYVTLNPLVPECDGRVERSHAKVGEVVHRNWFLIDIDTVRAEGFDKHSATGQEKEETRKAAYAIMESLERQGWPAPMVVDSGNGYHLLFRINLECTRAVQTVLRDVLKKLAVLHGGQHSFQIDKSVHNCNRITKIPGTIARKGPNLADRPHRMAKLLHVPEVMALLDWEQLTSFLEQREPETTDESEILPPLPPWILDANSSAKHAYAHAALRGEAAILAVTQEGGRNAQLNKSAFKLGGFVPLGLLTEQKIIEALVDAAFQCGLSQSEILPTIMSGLEAGKECPRDVPEEPDAPNEQAIQGRSVIIWAKSIKPKTVEWLWKGRLPKGKLVTFAGNGGLGKTFVICDIATRISQGLDWPDSEGECCERGRALLVSGEDDADDTLVPRLISQGADLSRVAFLDEEAVGGYTLANLEALDEAYRQMDGFSLVAVDPPTSFLEGIDEHKNAELRRVLTPLKHWAAKRNVTVIFNNHVNKREGQNIDATSKVMGSVAWVNAVRAAHMFTHDPDDDSKDRRLFCPMKSNLSKLHQPLAYRLVEDNDGLCNLEWLGLVDTTADNAVNGKSKSRKAIASEWLVAAFRDKLVWESDELFKAGRQEGVSRSAIYEAKKILNLPKPRKTVEPNGDVTWSWWVPEDWPQLAVREDEEDLDDASLF